MVVETQYLKWPECTDKCVAYLRTMSYRDLNVATA